MILVDTSVWVDAHLLASALVAGSGLWTFDQGLAVVAGELGLAQNQTLG